MHIDIVTQSKTSLWYMCASAIYMSVYFSLCKGDTESKCYFENMNISVIIPHPCVCVFLCVVSARQVRNWGRDPSLKDREARGWFCIHGDRESLSRKPTGSQGVQHAIGGLFRCHDAVVMETPLTQAEC